MEAALTRKPRKRKEPIQRFLSRVLLDDDDRCWEWIGQKNQANYGRFASDMINSPTRLVVAHKFCYEYFVGPVPKGLELDHLCRNRSCVNPSHLEPVTHSENVLRGASPELARMRQRSKTHCRNGHEFTPENTYFRKDTFRNCRACAKDVQQRLRDNAKLGKTA